MFMLGLRLRELREMIAIKIAWALPDQIVMWCAIRLIANATQGEGGEEQDRKSTRLTSRHSS